MDEYNFTNLCAKPYPLDRLIIPPIDNEEARKVLLKHGCRIEQTERLPHCILYFPEGTTQTEIFLRLTHPRYRITFPDGFELRETYDRYRNISILSYSAKQLEASTDSSILTGDLTGTETNKSEQERTQLNNVKIGYKAVYSTQ